MQRTILLLATLGLFTVGAAADETPVPADTLTATRVVALARTHAPQVRAAQSRLLEARGRLAGARALGQVNPTIEGLATTRDRFERRTQWELSVPIGIGLAWAGRTGVASAELEGSRQLVADVRATTIGAALAAYYQVLHASRRVVLAEERRSVAADMRRTAIDRHAAGEVPRLEVLLTETEVVRTESQLLAEEQALARVRLALASILGLPSTKGLVVAGDLEDRSLLTRTLAESVPARRADVLAAHSELRAAKAAVGLARSELLPGLAFRLDYGHESGEPLMRSGLAVTVPIFQHGQEGRRLARAREMRATVEVERAESRAATEIQTFEEIYEAAARSADRLGGEALPRVTESEGMVRESYRAGKIDLAALLVVRRDLLETRREHLDRLLDAALAGIDLAVARGQFQ